MHLTRTSPGRRAHTRRAQLLVVTLLSVPLFSTVTVSADGAPPETVTLENGGEGPTYDPTDYRGKLFEGVPRSKITQTCAYFQTAGTWAILGVKRSADATDPVYRVTINADKAGWNCVSSVAGWDSMTLLVYKQSGNAAIGGSINTCPGDSWFANGESQVWYRDTNACVRRGYKLVMEIEAQGDQGDDGYVLKNGGEGPSFDSTTGLGKRFTNVPAGVITQTCAYFGSSGQTATVVVAAPGAPVYPNPPIDWVPIYEVTLTSTSSGWNCDETMHAWGWGELLVYKIRGDAAIGANVGACPGDGYIANWAGYWWTPTGASWSPDRQCVRRGYMLAMGTAELVTDNTVQAGGYGAWRIGASASIRPKAPDASPFHAYAEETALAVQSDLEAAEGGDFLPLIQRALGFPATVPPLSLAPVYGREGVVDTKSDVETAPPTPRCYGIENHSGAFHQPLQFCSPFLP